MTRKFNKNNVLRKSLISCVIGLLLFTTFISLNYGNLLTNNVITAQEDTLSTSGIITSQVVNLTETAGLDRVNEPVTVSLSALDNGTAYHDSVRVYDNESSEIVSQVSNAVHDTFDADHNFESATDWADPSGWTIIEGSGSDVRVLPQYMAHSKVCELLDEGSGSMYYGEIREDFTEQDNGTIEFWIQNTDASKGLSFQASPTGSTTMRFALRLWEDKIQYYDGSFQDTGEAALDNTWYHVKITFESTTGLYDGLAQNKWRAYVTPENGSTIQLGDYDFGNSGSVGRVHFHCNGPHTGYSGFVDAVDYSWESGYFEGRNKYLNSCDVSFLANVSANTQQNYTISYNSESQGDPGYTDMTTGNTGTFDYIIDGNGGNWTIHDTVWGYDIRDPLDNIIANDWGGFSSDAQSPYEFSEIGPVFCQISMTVTNGFSAIEVYNNGYSHQRCKDDADYFIVLFGIENGVGPDEIQYKYDNTWGVKDPSNVGAGISWQMTATCNGNFNGSSFFNVDGSSWILTQVINLTQHSQADTFGVQAHTNGVGGSKVLYGYLGASYLIPANTETEFWTVLIESTADNDAQQRSDTEDLYTQLITNPLLQDVQTPVTATYKEQVTLTETAGLERINEPVTCSLEDLESGDAYHDSVRVYDGTTEIESQSWNKMNHAAGNGENETDWTDPSNDGWYVNAEPVGTTIDVLPNYMGWGKVIRVLDESASPTPSVRYGASTTRSGTGTWNVMMQAAQTNCYATIISRTNAGDYYGFNVAFGNDGHFKIQTSTGFENFDVDTTYTANTLYLITIEFNTTSETTNVSVDGVLKSSAPFYVSASDIKELHFDTYTMGQQGDFYIAWVDYSWAPQYQDGRYNYLKSCDVSFLANVSASASKTYNINYSSTSQGDPGYADMTTGSDYIDDGLGGRWYLETLSTQEVMRGTQDPNSNFVTGDGTNQGLLQLMGDNPTGTKFMDIGPVFCQAYRTQTGGYAIVDIYDSGIAKARINDDSNYHALTWGLRDGVGTDEHHYKTSSSWNVRDPITQGAGTSWTYGIVTSTNYNGQSFFNNDGESWILATLVDESHPGLNKISISAYTTSGGGHLLSLGDDQLGSSIPAYDEAEIYWALYNSTADDDAQQRSDTEDLYTRLISSPLSLTGGGSDTSIEAPTNLQATPSGRTLIDSFNLSWTNPSDPSSIVGVYYKLDSIPTSDTDGTYTAGADIENLTNIQVTTDGTHTIYVWLRDGEGNVDYTKRSSVELHLDILPPSYPSVNAPSVSQDSVTLSWTLVTDGSVVQYNIYRSSSPIYSISGLTPIASVNNQTNSYTDSGLEDGGYYYVITAVDDLGQESLVSNNIAVRIMHKIQIIIIVIIIIGIVSGIGATSGTIVYRRRRTHQIDKPKGKKKFTTQLDPDLIERIKKEEKGKMLTLGKIKDYKYSDHVLLKEAQFKNETERIKLLTELHSIPEADRTSLLKSIEPKETEEKLLRFLNASLQNIEIFESKQMHDHLREEYYKVLEIAEKLGNDNLFKRIQTKLEALEIEMEYNKE